MIKSSLKPRWEETFDFTMTFAEASSLDLVVSLKDEKGIFERQGTQFLGEVKFCLLKFCSLKPIKFIYFIIKVLIKLDNLDIRLPTIKWFPLQPSGQASEVLIDSGIHSFS